MGVTNLPLTGFPCFGNGGSCGNEDDGWLAELVEDDELDANEAGFIAGYMRAEDEGFE